MTIRIDAPISSGVIGESGAPHIGFTVETAKMTVSADPKGYGRAGA
jgi:hypothetical protein